MKYTTMMRIVLAFGILTSLVFASLPVIRYKAITETYEVKNKNELAGTTEIIKSEKNDIALATSNINVVVAKSKVEEKKEVKEQPKADNAVTNVAEASSNYSNVEASVDTSSVVNAAYSLLGTRYTAGGTSPSTGFDCSGFVNYVYGVTGTSIGRSSSAQLGNGSAISEGDLQPGDIIIWANNGSNFASHSSIYAGDGTIIHATSNKGVQQTNLNNWKNWGQHIIGIRRI